MAKTSANVEATFAYERWRRIIRIAASWESSRRAANPGAPYIPGKPGAAAKVAARGDVVLTELCDFAARAVHQRGASSAHQQRSLTMTTILIINAISSLVVAAGIGGVALRRARRSPPALQPVYVTSDSRRRQGR